MARATHSVLFSVSCQTFVVFRTLKVVSMSARSDALGQKSLNFGRLCLSSQAGAWKMYLF